MKKFIVLFVLLLIFLSGVFSEKYFHLTKLTESFKPVPVVSVVMSTYNRETAVSTAIDSILNQTFQNFEFIIIDDGSTDNTWKIIQFYAKKDSRIVPLKNEANKGLIYSLNRGLDVARGKYIARMDDDDKSVPFRLERQVLAMDKNPDIVVLGTETLAANETPVKNLSDPVISDPDDMAIHTYFTCGVAHPSVMMRREFLNKHHLRYNPKYLHAEDSGLWKDILNAGGKMATLKEKLLYFGVAKGMPKPPFYYDIQNEMYKHIQMEKIKPFWPDVPYEWLSMYVSNPHKCIIYKKMLESNETLKILNQTALKKRYDASCADENADVDGIYVSHPQWSDWLHINDDKKTFYRIKYPTETGKIIKEDDESVLVKWDHYGEETFIKEKNGKKWRLKEK